MYKHDPTDDDSLSSNEVLSLCEDHRGILWIGTDEGLQTYDRDADSFEHFENEEDEPGGLDDETIQALYLDSEGRLLIGTVEGLYRYDRESNQILRHPSNVYHAQALADVSIGAIHQDREGILWLGTEEGIFQYNGTQFRHFLHDPNDPYSLGLPEVNVIFEDRFGAIWIGADGGGLHRYNPESETFSHLQNRSGEPDTISHDQVNAIFEDRSGRFWVGTLNGLSRFHRETGTFVSYRSDPTDPASLSYNEITAVFEDRSGVLWFGTDGGGLNKFNPRTEHFLHYHHNPNNRQSLSHDRVWALYEDREGFLWIGTKLGGLDRMNRETEEFRHFVNDPENPQSLSSNEVTTIYEDRSGALWVGTDEGGLNRLDRESEKFTRFRSDENDEETLSSDSITVLYEDRSGEFWIGSDGDGLNLLDRATGKFTRYEADDEDEHSLSADEVWAIVESSDGFLWVGTGEGLNRLDRSEGNFTRYLADPEEPGSLSHSTVWSLFEDVEETLWIGTAKGLNRFDRKSGDFKAFTEEDGLAHESVFGILGDGEGNLWLGTGHGLSRFNPGEGTFRNYGVSETQNMTFNRGAYHRNSKGELFFGGMRGFNMFAPGEIVDNQEIPPVVITDFQIFNRSVGPGDDDEVRTVLEKAILETQDLTLTHRDAVFSFVFAALDYTIPSQNQYPYKLEGFDKDWNYIGTRRMATYTNIPDGRYVFRIRASNNDGIWNEEGATVQIRIKPPPWRTWWAYCLYAVVFIEAIIGLVHVRTKTHLNRIRRQERELSRERQISERLRRVDQLKDDFLAAVSHELRTPLHGIIGIAESLLDGVAGRPTAKMAENLSMIVTSGRRLASLVNDLLDFSKLKKRELEIQRRPIDMRTLTDVVLQLSAPLTTGKPLSLENKIDKNSPPVEGDENRIQQIMHNLIGNAIKFTHSGTVQVTAEIISPTATREELPAGKLAVSVSDTGIGIPADRIRDIFTSFKQVDASISREYGGSGLGLPITRQLVELHGGTIDAFSEFGKGSTFCFTLPISRESPETTFSPTQLAHIEPGTATYETSVEEDLEIVASSESKEDAGFSLLVVDDEPINQQVMANHLASGNFSVTHAYSGAEALDLISKNGKFDLILLDIMMPRLSGYEVCQQIRKQFLPNELPIIMITAKNQVADLVEGLSSGANDYIAKPFSKDELVARIKTHLNIQKTNRAYGRFVPREFLRILKRESIIDVQLGDYVLEEISILFSDIRSFTTLSEQISPKENFDFLNEYLSLMGPIIRHHDGFIDKYIGDAIMALFPLNVEHSIDASVEMMKQLSIYNANRVSRGAQPISIGIGLHVGSVMLGTVGEIERMDGTVIANAVNLASRLEGLTKLYGTSLVVSEDILHKLADRDAYRTRFLGKVKVKGKREAISVFEVYDGDVEEIKSLKEKTKVEFEHGLHHYLTKEFTRAAMAFEAVLAVNASDKSAKYYLEGSARFMVSGVPDDWEGVEVMETK